jgi:hypothetical protein
VVLYELQTRLQNAAFNFHTFSLANCFAAKQFVV